MAPTTNTLACSQTRLENRGANPTIRCRRAAGTVSIETLFWQKNGLLLIRPVALLSKISQMDKVQLSYKRFCEDGRAARSLSKVEEAESGGRDLLTDMASQIKRQIADARKRLAVMT